VSSRPLYSRLRIVTDGDMTAIYTSDLKRAHTTAKNVFEANLSDPKPPFTVSPLLREQYFGGSLPLQIHLDVS
jgi:broad specificity phosphatase PhoE